MLCAACSMRGPPVATRGEPASRGASPHPADPLDVLRDFENAARARTDFSHAPTSDVAFGPDPYVVRHTKSGDATRIHGLLRGRSALVQLDSGLHEVDWVPTPLSPTGLAVARDGELFVVGELSGDIARFRTREGVIRPAGSVRLTGVRSLRDVATGPEGVVYAIDDHDSRLLTLIPGPEGISGPPASRMDSPICHGPAHLLRASDALLVDCLLDHAIVLRQVDRHGSPVSEGEVRIVHDGPMWGMSALEDGLGLWLAVGGVEDHPLDRTEGSFGFVDSFVTLYRIADGAATKRGEVNTSALGLVTPKALVALRGPAGGVELAVAAYGSNRFALLTWDEASLRKGTVLAEPTVTTRDLPPGSAAIDLLPDGSFVVANPLLDAWLRVAPERVDIVQVHDIQSEARSLDSRLGEALFFTTLMAPWNRSDGRLSRFTCETCHFEGYVDGRTHHTGRGDVCATTKPLLGLLSNRPHFSRALDPDLTTMVDNEFRAAGARSDHDPWFSLALDDFPWTRQMGLGKGQVSPLSLRRALMTFFMEFTHRPNPSVVNRTRWSDLERAGANVFQQRCEACHQARLLTDDPRTRLPFEDWEPAVMSLRGPIVWARAEYAKTGVVPYVNESGARVVSLRRLYKKFPYFTNGSAKSLGDVLDRVRSSEDGWFAHDGAFDRGHPLDAEDKRSLAAFLDLL